MDRDSLPRHETTIKIHSGRSISTVSDSTDEGFVEDFSDLDCGSFASASDDEIDIEEVSESAEKYLEGVYYPVYIGEILADRYRIAHKLGWGGFSTVWMAQDIERRQLVALKIGIAGDSGKRELKMHQEILSAVKDVSRFLALLDNFSLTGIKGTHLVIVFPIRGPTIPNYYLGDVAPETKMRAAKQLLLAVKSLHDAEYIHGDLNGGSMLWDIGDIRKYAVERVYRVFGRPKKVSMYDTWKKGELVPPIEVDRKGLRGDVYLADFGLSVKLGSPPVHRRWQPPASYCAPERFHKAGPSFASDMWGYMCIFSELYLGLVPFSPGFGCGSVLSNLVRSLGPFPLQWADCYDANEKDRPKREWYDQTRVPISGFSIAEVTARARPDVSPVERKLAVSVMCKVWAYLPENRPTAGKLLEDDDFSALMAIYGC